MKSLTLISFVLFLGFGLLIQEAHSWGPDFSGWFRPPMPPPPDYFFFRGHPPPDLSDPDMKMKCSAALNYYNTCEKLEKIAKKCNEVRDTYKTCRDVENTNNATYMAPACCTFNIKQFDSCIRPFIPSHLRNTTEYPPPLPDLCNAKVKK